MHASVYSVNDTLHLLLRKMTPTVASQRSKAESNVCHVSRCVLQSRLLVLQRSSAQTPAKLCIKTTCLKLSVKIFWSYGQRISVVGNKKNGYTDNNVTTAQVFLSTNKFGTVFTAFFLFYKQRSISNVRIRCLRNYGTILNDVIDQERIKSHKCKDKMS